MTNICVTDIAKRFGAPESEIAAISDLFEAAKERFGNDTAKLKKYIDTIISNEKANVTAMKKDALVDMAKRKNLYNTIKERAATGDMDFNESLLEVFEGSQRDHKNARVSIDSTRKGIAGEAFRRLFRSLRETDGLVKMLRKASGEFEEAIRIELEDGIGASKKKYPKHHRKAKAVAIAMRKVTKYLHARADMAGISMGKIENYTPHSHDAQRILSVADTPKNKKLKLTPAQLVEASKKKWKKDLTKLLGKRGVSNSFGNVTDAQLDEILDKIFYNITEGRAVDVEAGKSIEMRVALRHAKHRVLHFPSGKASHIYHMNYGKKGGSVLAAHIDYINGMSRDIAATEFLGINSKENVKAVMQRYQTEMRTSTKYTPEQKAAMNPENIDSSGLFNPLGQAFEIAHGFADVPGSIKGARISRGFRAVANMAKLGRAALASIVDVATTGVNLTYHGVNPFKAYTDMFGEILQRVGSNRHQRQILDAIGVGFDSILGEIAHRYSAGEIGIGGKLGSWEATFFKLSGLEGWTDMLRSAGARISANHLGGHAKYRWSELSRTKSGRNLQRVLNLYGIDNKMWNIIRDAAQKELDGRMYILPERIQDSSLREALMRMYQEESTYFVTMPDAKTRRLMTQGMRPGTIPGEAIRFMGQFKSFPVGIAQKLFGRAYYAGDKAHIAHLVAAMMAMGYAAMTAKDLVSGKKPRQVLGVFSEDGFDPGIAMRTMFGTMLHSGAGGIYADFIFAAVNNRGNKFWDTIVGPVPGTVKDLVIDNVMKGAFVNIPKGEWDKLGARLAGEATENLPYANHFATKYVLDFAIFNRLLEISNPGALRRREKFLEEHYGQEYFIPPSDQID